MKVQASKQNPAFQPVQVVITLETPEEFKALYQVGNLSSAVAEKVSENSGLPKAGINELLKEVWKQLDGVHSDGIIR